MQTRDLNIVSLAYKARKIKLSADIVCEFLQKQQIKLVILACDASENTKKKIKDKTSFYSVDLLETLTSEQITKTIGKNCKVLGVTDEGFKKLILEKLSIK